MNIVQITTESVLIELKVPELLSMVQGITPNYNAMDHRLIKNRGDMTGAPNESWQWYELMLRKLNAKELLEIYQICAESWEGEKPWEEEDENV